MTAAKILIVEDNASKELEVRKALAPLGRDMTWLTTITDAFRLVTEQDWSLIILDMTFLVDRSSGFQSGRQSMAGLELLQFMASHRLTIPVIVATSHDTFSSPEVGTIVGITVLDDLLRDAFPLKYRFAVKVDLSEDDWKRELLDRAEIVLRTT